jgi:uncharacterized protein (TIGR03067 family)
MRFAVALLAVVALTAFAPAPLPKQPRRPGDATTLESCQGTWRVDRFEIVDDQGRLTKTPWGVSHFRIRGDRWTLLNNNAVIADVYRLAVDASKSPTHVDWLPRGQGRAAVEYVGIVKRRGDRLQITFINGSTNRPTNFENMPAGTCLVTATR